MEKIKKLTLHVHRWQAGFALATLAIFVSYILAATTPEQHGTITLFHILGMCISGFIGSGLFIFSCMDMWEHWDA